MPRLSSRRIVYLAAWLISALTLLIGASVARAGMNTGKNEPAPKLKPRGTQPTYAISVGLDGDVFPAFANYASFQNADDRAWGTVTVTVTNSSSDLLRSRVAVRIPGWSDEEIQMAEVAAGQVRKMRFAPSFLPRLYANRELTPATAMVTVTDGSGAVVFTGTAPARIRSAEDMYWGDAFKYAPFIASWVTPHDSRVEDLLAKAKEYAVGRRLPGYESGKSVEVQTRSTMMQARAIYQALQSSGVSYVKSSGSLGARSSSHLAERVRLPNESLRHVSANCIDGAVLYASLFENLGMDPVVVLVPGHAYVGVRLAENSSDFLYIETALTGRAPFQTAVQAAQRGVAKHPASEIIRVAIGDARQQGIFPMPNPRAGQELQVSSR